jgi:uncharacterized protein (TIGR03437 family)
LLGAFAALAAAQERSPLVYSTFFGEATPVAVEADAQGAAWVFGYTQSEGLPTTPNALQPEQNPKICISMGFHSSQVFPCGDLFVAKMNPAGSAFEYFTYIGGDSVDSAVDLALDADGAAYLLATTAGELPTTQNTLAPSKGSSNIWIAKLDVDGTLLWATYLDGVAARPQAIDVAPDGTVWVVGYARSGSLSVTPNAIQGVSNDQPDSSRGDGFLARLSADGSQLLYLSYFGGFGEDEIADLAIASDGSVAIAGQTRSPDFPVTAGAPQPTLLAAEEGPSSFAAKLSSDGSRLVYSTYLGGSRRSYATSVAVDGAGEAVIAATVEIPSFDFGDEGPPLHGFVVKLDSSGETILYDLEVGGYDSRVDLDAAGNAYLAAYTFPESVTVSPNAVQPCGASTPRSPFGGMAAKIDPAGSQVLYATFLSTNLSSSKPAAIHASGDGSFFVTGRANGRELPDTNPSAPHHRDEGAYVARIDPAGIRRDLFASLIRNGASYTGGPIAPGEWLSLFTLPLGPETPLIAEPDESGRLPAELGGLRVLINGVPALLTYAHRCQVNAIVPFGVEGATEAEVVVEFQGEQSNAVTLPVASAAPGLFSDDATGLGSAAALNEHGEINSPENRAHKGTVIALFGTGAGRISPALEDGEIPVDADSRIASETKVFVRDATQQWIEADVLYAGAAPGLVAGLVQVNFRLPESLIVPQSVLPLSLRPVDVKLTVDGVESRSLGVWVTP